jgi:hypothetical protein
MKEDLFELTPQQKKEFESFKKAYKKCIESGIWFYNNYGTIGALDSNKVNGYSDENKKSHIKDTGQNTHNELRTCLDSWADDEHYFHPKK